MRFIQAGIARNGKRHHVDIAGHQNLSLLPAAGHQLSAVVQPEFFYRALFAVQGALSLHQRLLVPLRLVVEQGIPGHSLRSEGRTQRAGSSLRNSIESPEHLGDVFSLRLFLATEPGTQA